MSEEFLMGFMVGAVTSLIIMIYATITSLKHGKSDSLRSMHGKSDEMRVQPQSGVEASRTPPVSVMGDKDASILKHRRRTT